jgi:hypothetical protein
MRQFVLKSRAYGFTAVELIAVLVVVAGLVVIFLPLLATPSRCGGRYIKDSTQVRGVHQGMVMWAQNNKDRYPIPSLIDADNTTIAGDAAAKDTTSNIMSVLIYNGFFGPELCVSPAESNPSIKQMTAYAYDKPASAASPAKALWDPAFNADFTGGKTGHFSYAHIGPFGPRLEDYTNSFSATTPCVGNRGPAVSDVTYKSPTTAAPSFDAHSNTLSIHGARTTWEGNIAYNDNHVNFETRMDPEGVTYKDAGDATFADCLFFDEPQDKAGRNAYLSIWAKAGPTPADFRSIWD